jgi:hypothetical protein
VDGPSVLIVDNFVSHVSDEGLRVVGEVAYATVAPLPPNSTAVCQPLDVGVMGPLKAIIRGRYVPNPKVSAREKRFAAIKATIAAWDAISPSTVVRSFEKAIPRFPVVNI